MATTADIPRLEMLQVADMVAREKGIEREEVLEAMEQAIQKSGRLFESSVQLLRRCGIDLQNGTGKLKALLDVGFCGMVVNTIVFVFVSRFTTPPGRQSARRQPRSGAPPECAVRLS